MKRSILILVAFVALGLIACNAETAPAASASKTNVLDQSASQLRTDFNNAKGSVRLLLIVDPACSVCLRGLSDVNDALLKRTHDPRIQTFVVHENVIGGELGDVAPASTLLSNPNVHHYWDPSGNFGREVSKSLNLKHHGDPVYAWDVWMVYDGNAALSAQGAPEPALFMHQLPKLRGEPGRPTLDGDVLARKATELLGLLPARAKQ